MWQHRRMVDFPGTLALPDMQAADFCYSRYRPPWVQSPDKRIQGKVVFRLVQLLLDVDPVPRPTLVGLCKGDGDAEDEFDKNGTEVIDHYI